VVGVERVMEDIKAKAKAKAKVTKVEDVLAKGEGTVANLKALKKGNRKASMARVKVAKAKDTVGKQQLEVKDIKAKGIKAKM